MNPCADCIHYAECFERRGECVEFKTLETIRREIIELNNAYKAKASTRPKDRHENNP